MSVDFRIMAVRQRREKYILPMLKSLGMDESIVLYDDEYNKKEKNINAYRCCKRAFLLPTTKTHVCVLQDDLELCDNFVEIAEKCAETFPNAVFSFYQSTLTEADKLPDSPYVKINGCGMYGQCIMIPSSIINIMFDWIDCNYGLDYTHSDIPIGAFCLKNNVSVMATNPCILQHLAHNDSAMGYNNKNKVSKVYSPHIDVEQFGSRKYFEKYVANGDYPPVGGYKFGKLLSIAEMVKMRT